MLRAAQCRMTCVRPRQDCPGKATHTVLLACVSAADICHEQTLQTLRFAERARSRNLPGSAPLLLTAACQNQLLVMQRYVGLAPGQSFKKTLLSSHVLCIRPQQMPLLQALSLSCIPFRGGPALAICVFAAHGISLFGTVMGLAAPNEEAYLQRLLSVQQQDRLAAMALAEAPAAPQLQWEGDVPQDDLHQQTETEPLSCIVPSSAPFTPPAAAAATGNDGGSHLQLISMMPDRAHRYDALQHAAVPAASSARNNKTAGEESPVPTDAAQRRARRASNRRDSSRSDASGSASLGGSSSGRSETAARIRFHAAAASKSNASEALEPPTPDQVQMHSMPFGFFSRWYWLFLGNSTPSAGHSMRPGVEVSRWPRRACRLSMSDVCAPR